MDSHTYKLLRRVARDIQQSALESGQTAHALEQLTKAAVFLAEEIQVHGDISLVQRSDCAAALRAAAIAAG